MGQTRRTGLQTSSSRHSMLAPHAFVKKTRRTPSSEIELGRKRLKEVLSA